MSSRKFFGSNRQASSRRNFTERARYRNNAIPDEFSNENPGLFRDFWFIENMYYGRIDFDHRFLLLKEEHLTTIEAAGGANVNIFNFVADAYNAFVNDYNKAVDSGKIFKNDDFLSEISAVNGYVNPLEKYNIYFLDIRNKFQKELNKDSRRIEDFNDFVNYFIEYITLQKDRVPITFTGFIASRFCSPLSTGLFIDLSSLEYGKDEDKINKFIDRPNYKFFMKNCLKHGFMIDKNVPWRICANIGSQEMLLYMLKYGVTTDTIFNEYYNKTYTKDIDYIMEYLLKFYNRFVSIKPYIRKEIFDEFGASRFSQKRHPVTLEEINLRYDHAYRLDLYIKLRNFEANERYDTALLERIKANAISYLKIDTTGDSSYDYVDRQFKGFLNDMGAYNAFTRKEDIKANDLETTGQQLESELQHSVSESRKTFY